MSGRQVIIEKVVAARSGNAAAAAEIQAARAPRAHGLNVHFRVAAGDVSAEGLPTSDFLVGGFRGRILWRARAIRGLFSDNRQHQPCRRRACKRNFRRPIGSCST